MGVKIEIGDSSRESRGFPKLMINPQTKSIYYIKANQGNNTGPGTRIILDGRFDGCQNSAWVLDNLIDYLGSITLENSYD